MSAQAHTLVPPSPLARRTPPGSRSPHRSGVVRVLGVDVDRFDRVAARRAVLDLLTRPQHECLSFVNAHGLTLAARDPEYRETLAASAMVLNDGLGLAIAARLDHTTFPANLNGSDLLPELLADFAAHGYSVFFYGAEPGVAARTARHWQGKIPALRVAGELDGFTVSSAAAAEIVRRSGADVVLVALGNPRQEVWARQFGPRTGASLSIGVGAFFDFSAGVVRRAPRPVRRLRLEWAFRLAQEPRRLARRYLLGIPEFLLRVGVARMVAGRSPAPFPLTGGQAASGERHPSRGRAARTAREASAVVLTGPWSVASDVEQVG